MEQFLKKGWRILALILWAIARWVGQYNGLVSMDEEVKKAWANVEWQYQRRVDLIPNLVKTVQAFADQETKVFIDVTEARTKATSITVNVDDPSTLQQFANAQWELSQWLWRLLAVAENYPDLKSNENFLDLQKQLEGTENRIAVARWAFNQAVKEFSTKVRQFPVNMIAWYFWFEPRDWFSAEPWAEVVPEVDFDI
jgi:LemA protein